MIVEEEVYLEHYGKKGMRWGVRNSKRANMSPEKRERIRKLRKKMIIGGAIGAAGGLAVGKILQNNRNVKMAKIRQINQSKDNIKRMSEVFSATLGDGRKVSYGRQAEEAFRKAGAFGPIPMGPIGSTSIARLRGAIPMPRA